MDTFLVRLKTHDPRRGHVLRRYSYQGIRFEADRGWYRTEKPVADYLRGVRQVSTDGYSPLAFDVCTDQEAKALEAAEAEESKTRRTASDDLQLVTARPPGAVTTEDIPKATAGAGDDKDPRRGAAKRDNKE